MKAGALMYAIFVCFVLFVSTSMLVLLFYFHSNSDTRLTLRIENSHKLRKTALLLLRRSNLEFGNTTDIVVDGENSFDQNIQYWGTYGLLTLKDKQYSVNSFSMIFGYTLSKENIFYLTDLGKPLYLSGSSRIDGNTFLPKDGLKESINIGMKHLGSIGIQKQLGFSTNQLPVIDRRWMVYAQNPYRDSTLNFRHQGYKRINSFESKQLILVSDNDIVLDNDSLIGYISVFSKKKIIVRSSVFLKDVILYAPSIYIEQGFVGCTQLFATDTIELGENCHLTYPSALVLMNKCNLKNALIELNEHTSIDGAVISLVSEECHIQVSPIIQIAKSSKVNGFVYSIGNLELLGVVNGTLYANQISTRLNSGIMYNYLNDGVVNTEKVGENFIGPVIFDGGNYSLIKKVN